MIRCTHGCFPIRAQPRRYYASEFSRNAKSASTTKCTGALLLGAAHINRLTFALPSACTSASMVLSSSPTQRNAVPRCILENSPVCMYIVSAGSRRFETQIPISMSLLCSRPGSVSLARLQRPAGWKLAYSISSNLARAACRRGLEVPRQPRGGIELCSRGGLLLCGNRNEQGFQENWKDLIGGALVCASADSTCRGVGYSSRGHQTWSRDYEAGTTLGLQNGI